MPARVDRGGVEQRPRLPQRATKRAVGPAADQGRAVVGSVQAQDHPHGGGLAGAVGADEAGHVARLDPGTRPNE